MVSSKTALLLAASSILLSAAICPPGYDIFWRGGCRRLLQLNTPVTAGALAEQQLRECARDGGFPAKVETQEEVDFAHAQWAKGVGAHWLLFGVICDTKSDTFKWADGTEIIQWADLSKPCASNVLRLNAGANQTSVAPVNSSEYYNAWCYIPNPEMMDEGCYDFDAAGDTCIRLSTEAHNWADARRACQADLSDVASIHSKQTNDFIRRQAVARGFLGGVLIGGQLPDYGSDVTWSDGSPMDYENFAPGFPLPLDGTCLAMETNSVAGQWSNANCAAKLPFACSRKVNAQAPACGDRVYQEGDIIYSPGYPKTASEPCDYLLQVPERKILQLEILHLEANGCCDRLVLYDGAFGGRVVANLTGGKHEGARFRTFSSHTMHVAWEPKGGVGVRGFAATFRAL